MSADRNLLFAIFALHNDFIDREELVEAMNAWLLQKQLPFGQVLVERKKISSEQRDLLERLLDLHVVGHGSVEESLASLSSVDTARQLLESIDDDDLQASLSRLNSYATVKSNLASQFSTLPHKNEFLPGLTGGRFRILKSHARGGLGEVFVAEDLELHREVALKEIQNRYSDDASSRGRFVLEAEITGNLEHPGIVPVYGLGAYPDGRPFYAMRFIKGDNLKEAIEGFHARGGNFVSVEFRRLLARFVDVCNAIAYAHSRGVLHRDLKPGNIMLGKFGETLVVDWGLAKVVNRPKSIPDTKRLAEVEDTLRPASGSAVDETLPGRAVGTPMFMSPEQAAGEIDKLGPATDVYSLGATLYVLLAGKPPFGQKAVIEILDAVQRGDFPAPQQVNPKIPPGLNAVCIKAMALKPLDRFSSGLELASEIERWLADEPLESFREPLKVRVLRWVRRHRTLVGSAIAASLVAMIGFAVATFVVREKNVVLLQAKTEADESFAMAFKAVNTYLDAVTDDPQLKQNHLVGLRSKLLETAIPFYGQFTSGVANRQQVDLVRVQALHRLATLQRQTGARIQSLENLKEAVAGFEDHARRHPTNNEFRQAVASGLEEQGTLLRELGRIPESIGIHESAIVIRRKLAAQDPEATAPMRSLARSLTNSAIALESALRLNDAAQNCREALQIQQTLVKTNLNATDFANDAAYSHATLGGILSELGNRSDAEAEFRKAIEIRSRLLVAAPRDFELRRELANDHARMAMLVLSVRDLKKAQEACDAEQLIRQQLVTESPSFPNLRSELHHAQMTQGVLHQTSGRADEAVSVFSLALTGFKNLSEEYPDVPSYREAQASCHHGIASVNQARDWLADVEESYSAERKLLEQLVDRFPANSEYRTKLFGCLNNLGNLYAKLYRFQDARILREAVLPLCEKLIADAPEVEGNRVRLGAALCNRGLVDVNEKQWLKSLPWFDRSIERLKPLADGPKPLADSRAFLKNSYSNRALALVQLGRHADAAEDYVRAAAYLDDKSKLSNLETDEAMCRARLGQFQRAVALADKLLKEEPFDSETKYDAACIFALCAKSAVNDPKVSKAHADRAMQLLKAGSAHIRKQKLNLEVDEDFSILRQRPDFVRLIGDLRPPLKTPARKER